MTRRDRRVDHFLVGVTPIIPRSIKGGVGLLAFERNGGAILFGGRLIASAVKLV